MDAHFDASDVNTSQLNYLFSIYVVIVRIDSYNYPYHYFIC